MGLLHLCVVLLCAHRITAPAVDSHIEAALVEAVQLEKEKSALMGGIVNVVSKALSSKSSKPQTMQPLQLAYPIGLNDLNRWSKSKYGGVTSGAKRAPIGNKISTDLPGTSDMLYLAAATYENRNLMTELKLMKSINPHAESLGKSWDPCLLDDAAMEGSYKFCFSNHPQQSSSMKDCDITKKGQTAIEAQLKHVRQLNGSERPEKWATYCVYQRKDVKQQQKVFLVAVKGTTPDSLKDWWGGDVNLWARSIYDTQKGKDDYCISCLASNKVLATAARVIGSVEKKACMEHMSEELRLASKQDNKRFVNCDSNRIDPHDHNSQIKSNYFKPIWQVVKLLDTHRKDPNDADMIAFTGHSLGGGLAALLSVAAVKETSVVRKSVSSTQQRMALFPAEVFSGVGAFTPAVEQGFICDPGQGTLGNLEGDGDLFMRWNIINHIVSGDIIPALDYQLGHVCMYKVKTEDPTHHFIGSLMEAFQDKKSPPNCNLCSSKYVCFAGFSSGRSKHVPTQSKNTLFEASAACVDDVGKLWKDQL